MTSLRRELLVVADASPLILLAKIGRLPLLNALAEEIWVPSAVWDEIIRGDTPRPEVPAILALLQGAVRAADQTLPAHYAQQVDCGEAAALALVTDHRHALLLIDDRRGRQVAAANGLRHIGTLGLLLRAKRHLLLDRIAPELEALRRPGLFMDTRTCREVLLAAGEAEDRV